MNQKHNHSHIIVGATGRVGSATARALLRRGEAVTVVTRNETGAASLAAEGAQVAVADIRDTSRLRSVFRSGTRVFLLNPPADPSSDTEKEELANVQALLAALDGSGLEKVVAASTYGARPGERCGDLTVLHHFEEGLRAQPIPAAVNRGAYYMSNWAGFADLVRETGVLPNFFPERLPIATVAPEDIGEAAAVRMLEPNDDTQLRHIEGPRAYTPRDVADAFAELFRKPVRVDVVPHESWEATFLQFGFSKEAAASYACMTSVVVDGQIERPDEPVRGKTTFKTYLSSLAT